MAQNWFRLALAMGSATGMGIQLRSEDAEFFFLAIARPDVHPPRGTGPAVGGLHLVINRRIAVLFEVVDVTQRALVIAGEFGNPLLGQGGAWKQPGKGEQRCCCNEVESLEHQRNQQITEV